MKTIKRISLATLVLVMVLSALLAIPASAQIEPTDDEDIELYTTSKCTCVYHEDFYVQFASRLYAADGNRAYAATEVYHPRTTCTDIIASHTATIWYYPNYTSSAYNTFTNYASDGFHQSSNGTRYSVAATNRTASGTQVLFCIETSHTLTTNCTPCGQKTYTGYTCAGEIALK